MNFIDNATKKALLLVFISCVMLVSTAHAIYYPKTIRPFFETCEDITPPSIWLHAEVLYWGAYQDGLSISDSFEDEGITPNGAETAFRSNSKNLCFDWKPGFRVGIGSGFIGRGGWGGIVSWTHLFSSARRTNDTTLRGHWKLHFDSIDAIAGLEILMNPCMNLNLVGGISSVRIAQHFRTKFTENEESSSEVVITKAKDHNQSKFYGIGPKLGVEAEWQVKCGISLYGSLGGSILFGHMHVARDRCTSSPSLEELRHRSKSLNFCQTVADAAIGIRWNRIWHCGFNASLELGLEHHQFFNQNRVGECGDLYLDGLVGAIRFGF
jgi:hypothetical protein